MSLGKYIWGDLMKLTKKLFVILVATIIVPTVIGIGITYYSIKYSVEKIETDNTISKIHSVEKYLESLADNHGSNYLSWTMWTEYYEAIAKRNVQWLDENVFSSAQDNTPAETILSLDKSARIIGQINAPKDWQNLDFTKFNLYKKLNFNTHYASGIINTSDGLYIATIVKVVKSDDINFTNPNGYTVYAMKFSDRMVQTGKTIINVDIGMKLDNGRVWATTDNLKNITHTSKQLKAGEILTNSKTKNKVMSSQAEQIFTDSAGVPIGILAIETSTQSGVIALNRLFYAALILTILVLMFSSLALGWLRQTVINPIIKITNIIIRRDLSQLLKVKNHDEIGSLCVEFNKMIEDQREVISKFKDAANLVGETSQQVSCTTAELSTTAQNQAGITEEFTHTVESMNTKIQDISTNVTKLAGNISDVSNSIGDMSNNIQDISRSVEEAFTSISGVSVSTEQLDNSITSISKHAKEVGTEAESAVSKAKEGNITVSNTIQEMDKISKAVNELSLGIQGLGVSAEMIGEIVNVIDDIAEQTNLLSLNAAIEAARAGEAGKGFAVVANSIRGLAEKSGEATKDISKLIKGIQAEVTNAVAITNESTQRVRDGVQYVRDTGLVFEDIFKAIDNTSGLIKQIAVAIGQQESDSRHITSVIEKMRDFLSQLSASAEEQAAGTDEIVRTVGRINYLVQQVSIATKEHALCSEDVVKLIQGVNEGTNEISSGSEEIAASIYNLVLQAQELLKVVEQFKI